MENFDQIENNEFKHLDKLKHDSETERKSLYVLKRLNFMALSAIPIWIIDDLSKFKIGTYLKSFEKS